MSDRTSPVPPEGVELEQAALDDSASEQVAARLAKLDLGTDAGALFTDGMGWGPPCWSSGSWDIITPQHV